ncbi:hypothetical protein ACIRYZ_14580 [Kitasatospora sp. NPDC101155]|uniref:hypothetical protein n=1 Tax=Kitasatospora sp. NPDC101155 TaxID=3364097 RepID=UPI0037FD300E
MIIVVVLVVAVLAAFNLPVRQAVAAASSALPIITSMVRLSARRRAAARRAASPRTA